MFVEFGGSLFNVKKIHSLCRCYSELSSDNFYEISLYYINGSVKANEIFSLNEKEAWEKRWDELKQQLLGISRK